MNPIDESAPPPPLVTPGRTVGDPPSDAVILFDGRELSKWTRRDGSPAGCTIENREMVCRTGAQNIVSVPTFGSAQVHLEYAVPDMPAKTIEPTTLTCPRPPFIQPTSASAKL